ncbi:hypothetical protein WN48_01348 [Eufriesea mexicana]|uniref:Uncharacterized protein n=1 Tax=Eufriesea mexicana TaxID=516756 RepID=A0A310SGC7_9HYME|nr:hypothetical protein WN48_01348 [Eufriesea mexicana]
MSQSPDDKFNKSNMLNRKSARRLSINNRELLIAISENDYDKVECLINGEIDINFKDTDGKTPLYWAIESNNDAIIKLLLRKQGINIKRTEIETLIDYVRPLNRPDILKILETSLKSKVADQNAVAEHYQCNSNIDQVLEFSTFKKLESRKKNKIQSKQKIGNNPIHGNIYQLNLLMLFLYRSVSLRYSFQLGTEISEADKFDDLVFEYIENGKTVYRLLQAKHKLNESKKITTRDLFAEHNGDYSLVKYFMSYQKSKNNELFKNGFIKDVTICTNIDWDYEDLKKAKIGIQKIRGKDDILDFKNIQKQPLTNLTQKNLVTLLKMK